MGLFVRTIGIARARAKIGMANLAYDLKRFVWHQGELRPYNGKRVQNRHRDAKIDNKRYPTRPKSGHSHPSPRENLIAIRQ